MKNEQQAGSTQAGSTLIEVALAVVVLAVLAIGAAALYSQNTGQLFIQQNKRAALVVANAQMESIRASSYSAIEPPGSDFAPYYLSDNGGVWQHSTGDPEQTKMINGRAYPITTTVQRVDADPENLASVVECLNIRVAVAYRLATPDDRVVLDSLFSP